MALNDSNTFACITQSNGCHLKCSIKNTCKNVWPNSDLLDGSWCGVGKVCLYFKCVDVDSAKREKFIDDEQIMPKSLLNSNLIGMNAFEYSAQLIANLCPFGTMSNLYNQKSPIQESNDYYDETIGSDLFEKSETCDYVFNRIEKLNFCTNRHATNFLCCEKCIQYNMTKAISYSGKVKCESFAKNPCYNNGKCENVNNGDKTRSGESFVCKCKTGFYGKKNNFFLPLNRPISL